MAHWPPRHASVRSGEGGGTRFGGAAVCPPNRVGHRSNLADLTSGVACLPCSGDARPVVPCRISFATQGAAVLRSADFCRRAGPFLQSPMPKSCILATGRPRALVPVLIAIHGCLSTRRPIENTDSSDPTDLSGKMPLIGGWCASNRRRIPPRDANPVAPSRALVRS